jgi:hypothetical protein
MSLSVVKGEFLDADKVTALIGGVVASITVQLCPRALRWGCSFAAVCGLGLGRLARSEVMVTPLLASAEHMVVWPVAARVGSTRSCSWMAPAMWA